MSLVVGVLEVPGTILVGGGARREVGDQLRRCAAGRVLLVTDPGVVRLGVAAEVAAEVARAGFPVTVFDAVQPDPTDRNVDAGLARLRAEGCDAIVALGGGSAIDAAKAISVAATNAGPLARFAGYHRIERAGLPLVAIPTTAGTGSEATKVTVITDTARDVKMMMLSGHLVPRVALVDYELTLTMPGPLTAAVGVDTLTHGIEAYVSQRAHGLTDPLALSCIDLVARHLRTAFHRPDDRAARAGMMLAACQGGMAFSNSSVCLVHGMSRPLGAVFHIPHGLSNAVLLPTVTRYSCAANHTRYAEVARRLGGCPPGAGAEEAAATLAGALERLNADLGLPRLRECPGVDEGRFRESLPKMAADALASGSPQNNPRVPDVAEIVRLYEQAW